MDFLTCPCSFHNPEIYTLLELEKNYNKFGASNIYNNRAIPEFPAKLLQYFRIVRNFITEKEIKEQKKKEQEINSKIKK